MRKIDNTNTQSTETNIELLESCAKAFIKEALISKTKKTDAIKMIQNLWNDVYLEAFPLKEESSEEKAFRTKAQVFWNKHYTPMSEYINSSPCLTSTPWTIRHRANRDDFRQWDILNEGYSEPSLPIETSIFLEVICAIYKAFINLDSIEIDDIANIASERLDKIYVQYANQHRTYVKLVVTWFKQYFSKIQESVECSNFIAAFDCTKPLEKFVCRLVWEVQNCC